MRQLWETLFNWKVIMCCLINASVITPGMCIIVGLRLSNFTIDNHNLQYTASPCSCRE